MTVTQLKITFKERSKVAVESAVEKHLTFYDSTSLTSWVYSIYNTLALVRLAYKKESKF